jgi:hypothetical protein
LEYIGLWEKCINMCLRSSELAYAQIYTGFNWLGIKSSGGFL